MNNAFVFLVDLVFRFPIAERKAALSSEGVSGISTGHRLAYNRIYLLLWYLVEVFWGSSGWQNCW